MEAEIWKDIQGFEGFYQISNRGRVKSVARPTCGECGHPGRPERIRKTVWNGQRKYDAVSLCRPGMGARKNKLITVHRLVAIHFVTGRSEQRYFVNHKDGNRNNNCEDNLEWVTVSENTKHAHATGLVDRQKLLVQLAKANAIRWEKHRKAA